MSKEKMGTQQLKKKPLDVSKLDKSSDLEAPTPPIKVSAKPVIMKPTAPIKSVAKKVQKPVAKAQPEKIVRNKLPKQKVIGFPEEHDKYFVYLRNPMEYRRQLLESSRKILYCLKNHQRITLIRQKKLEAMRGLKNCVRELIYLNKKFNEMLPKYNTGFLEGVPSSDKNRPVQIKPVTAKKIAEVKTERSEMDRLEDSLASIEKKLRSLQ